MLSHEDIDSNRLFCWFLGNDIVFFRHDVYTITMSRPLRNNYDIDKIMELINSINPATQRNYSISAISEKLGYSDPASLIRWLKRWHIIEVVSPATYSVEEIKREGRWPKK